MTRVRRVYHAALPDESGRCFDLDADEAHHVHRVLRLEAGETVGVFDGAGHEWRASIVTSRRDRVTLRLDTSLGGSVEAPVEIVLFQAMCRPERMDWVVQKATEVGLAAIRPVVTDRSGPYGITENRLTRWRRVAVEACKQSGRRRVPLVEPSGELPDAPGTDVLAILLDAGEGARPLAETLGTATPAQAWIAVGPEGGFEPDEVAGRVEAGWQRAGLGPRTLRTDTAGVIAAALLLHRLGDLGS